MRVAELEAIDTEFRLNGAGRDAVAFDLVEGREELGDVPIRLIGAPAVAGVHVDIVKLQRCRFLDADGHLAR